MAVNVEWEMERRQSGEKTVYIFRRKEGGHGYERSEQREGHLSKSG